MLPSKPSQEYKQCTINKPSQEYKQCAVNAYNIDIFKVLDKYIINKNLKI